MKKFYLLIIVTFSFLSGSFAQSAINPVTGGNFDEGNSFVANGWTVVNSSANEWVVGTGADAMPPSSPNTAYISIDGNPANYSYDNTTAHISHFYQVVTLPANAVNIAINFQLKGNYEDDADSNLVDGLEVYTNDATVFPVADALPSGVNAIQQFIQTSNNTEYIGQSRSLNYYAGKTFLVIFTWINNGDDIGDGPPASVDQASLTYCIKGAKYTVTGGGAFCTGSSGVGVGLSGSDTAISYQLYNNASPIGDPINGTGSALDFGPQNVVGTYTIVGTSACNVNYPMTGSAVVTETPLPTATAGSNAPLCLGSTLDLNSNGGTTYSWTGPNGFTSDVQNPSISNFTSSETGIYTVFVTNNACSASASTTVSVTGGGVVGGTIPSVSVCGGSGGTLHLSGNSNSPSSWESTTDIGSGSWNTISNVADTQNFSGIVVPTYFRAVVSDGCGQVYSDTATVDIHNYWTGGTSIDWNTPGNWSDNAVPSTSCADVFIPGSTKFQPTLSTGTAAITNLHILSGGALTVTGATIQIAGTISNGGIFDVTNGTVELNGTSTQNIEGKDFANGITGENNTVKNLIISNNDVEVASGANDTLNITGTLSFGTSSAQLTTGNNITLKSSATATANVGMLGTGNNISGNVTVERYIDVGKGHGASWEFVATPTRGQTVYQSWMENGCCLVPPVSTGYGTTVTDPSGTANGFDLQTPGASLKSYVYTTDSWLGIGNPTTTGVYNPEGYMLFVRGDRSVFYPNTDNTTLRTSGTLWTASPLPPPVPVTAGYFASVGNPYASAIYISKIHLNKVNDIFYVWDPTLTGVYGVGAYVALSDSLGIYVPTPSGGGDYASGTQTFESGQAFFVQSDGTGNGSVSFDENVKANSSRLVFRGAGASGAAGPITQLRANLYGVAGNTPFLTDGNLIQYNTMYSDKVDGLDAKKLVNSSENFGILSGGKNLAIERRTDIQQSDTIFYNLTGVRAQNYRIVFMATGLSAYGLQGFIEDTYLKTRKPLNMEGTTEADFAVTSAAGSYAANRFRIVFAPQPPVEVGLTFITLTAQRQDANIAVNWKVQNEKGMQQYEVEKSMDGVNFTKVGTVAALNSGIGSYQWIDTQVTPGDNYYRIRCVGMDGSISYSTVVEVTVVYENPSIAIYPNPITDGIIHLQFVNQPQGRYGIRLLNSLGQLISAKQIEHPGGDATENIQWNYYLSHGVYQLEVIKPDGSVKIIKVLY